MKRLNGIKIREKSLLAFLAAKKLNVPSVALTLGNSIHLYNVSSAKFWSDEKWVRHELTHVMQFRRHGYIRFLYMYLIETLKKGYYNNKFEVEARKNEAIRPVQPPRG